MLSKLRKGQKGFTLIELLIVVAIIGIIAAILIPNFLDALQKGRMKRTMGDIRQIGLTLGQYYVDSNGAAAAGQAGDVVVADWDTPDNATQDYDTIAEAVQEYSRGFQKSDAWNNEFEFHVTLVNPPRVNWALIRSMNLDDEFDGDTYEPGQFSPTDYESDCVWADGGFVRSPLSSSGS